MFLIESPFEFKHLNIALSRRSSSLSKSVDSPITCHVSTLGNTDLINLLLFDKSCVINSLLFSGSMKWKSIFVHISYISSNISLISSKTSIFSFRFSLIMNFLIYLTIYILFLNIIQHFEKN